MGLLRYSPEAIECDWQKHIRDRFERELEWKLPLLHDRFEQLWREAHREGAKAMASTTESKFWCMVHVRIPDGLFASWLVKTGKGTVDADFDGKQRAVRIYSLVPGADVIHDCARKEAYAKAFARVLIWDPRPKNSPSPHKHHLAILLEGSPS